MGHDFFDGVKKLLGVDLAGAFGVAPLFGFGDTMLAIVIPSGLDGPPGELVGVTFFVFEDLFADAEVAFFEAVSVGKLKSAEDFHFEVR